MDTQDLVIKYGLGTPKRFSPKQKRFFINEIGKDFQQYGYNVVGKSGKMKSTRAVNLVVGDPKTASTIIVANYDTPTHNFGNPMKYHPFNGPATFASSFLPIYTPLIIGIIVLIYVVTQRAGNVDFDAKFWPSVFTVAAMLIAAILPPFMIVAVPNKINMNYNTSGCIGALKIAEKLSPEKRKNVAFVLTDQGCKKFAGDYLLREMVPDIDDKLTIVLDCLGDGEEFVIGYKEDTANEAKKLGRCFENRPKLHSCSKEDMRFSSFSYYLRGLKLSRVTADGASWIVKNVSTNHDINCDPKHIDEAVDGIVKFLES